MQRIAIFTTDDGGEVAIQVVDDAPPDAVEAAPVRASDSDTGARRG